MNTPPRLGGSRQHLRPRGSTAPSHHLLHSYVVWAALGLALAACGIWWLSTPEPAPGVVLAKPDAFPWARANPPAEVAAVKLQAPLPPPAAPQAAPVSAPAVFDICGVARISAPAGSDAAVASAGLEALPAHLGSEPLATARERMLTRLREGGPQARVAALLLARPEGEDPAAQANWAQALLQQARASGQVSALAWAEEACGYLPDGPACRIGLIRERLRLEPDNAHHWAALADEDPSAAEEAWQGMRQAKRWHAAPQSLTLLAQAAMPPDLPPYLRMALGAELTTRSVALPMPGEGWLMERCSSDGNTGREHCSHLAGLLVEHSDSVLGLVQGGKLAKLAAWPAARLESLQRELRSFDQPGVYWSPENGQPLSCASVQAWQQQLDEVRTMGELAAMRSRAARATGTGT